MGPRVTSPDEPELRVAGTYDLQTDTGRLAAINLVDRAANAGYHGMVLADFKFHLLHTKRLTAGHPTTVCDVVDYADGRGLAFVPAVLSFGYAEGIVYEDPGCERAHRITSTGWDGQDERVVADTCVFHNGAAAARAAWCP